MELDTEYKNDNYNMLKSSKFSYLRIGPEVAIPDSTKMNQDWRYIMSKRIFKSRRTSRSRTALGTGRAVSLLTLGT